MSKRLLHLSFRLLPKSFTYITNHISHYSHDHSLSQFKHLKHTISTSPRQSPNTPADSFGLTSHLRYHFSCIAPTLVTQSSSKELGHPPTTVQSIAKYPQCVSSQGAHASDPSIAAVQEGPHHGGGTVVHVTEAGFSDSQERISDRAHPGQRVRDQETEKGACIYRHAR